MIDEVGDKKGVYCCYSCCFCWGKDFFVDFIENNYY